MTTDIEILERIRAKSERNEETGCLIYQGGKNQKGYGRIYYNGKTCSAHRVVYKVSGRMIPHGFDVHHTCGNRACCRIDHLQAIPHRLNTMLTAEYISLRWLRLQDLLTVNLELNFFGETRITSTDLSIVWGKNFKGSNLTRYLETLAFVFESDFEWRLIKRGAGRRPHLLEIKLSDSLRKALEDDENKVSLTPFNPLVDTVA